MTRRPAVSTRYRPQPIAEIAIHFAIADLLRRTCNPRKWEWTHIPLGEKRDPITASKLWRMGARAGWPDFVFVAKPSGHIYFLELKRFDGDLLGEQSRFASEMSRCANVEFKVARSIEEAIRILGAWGVVPVKVEDAA